VRIVGVDPGASGALAVLDEGLLKTVSDMPVLKIRRGKTDKPEVDGYALSGLFRQWKPDIVVIEQVGGIPGQSAPAAFNFGRSAGAVEYTAKALSLRVEMVAPVTWKKALRCNEGKDGARALASRLWPAQAGLFARVKDDGRAESALVAEWGRRNFGGANVFE
jgi:crossover junction endodeoxyribonuclease RuvC